MAERHLTLPELGARKRDGRKLVVLTCYDALFARLLEAAGVDLLLVGDSLNQVLTGRASTLSATLDQMIYHAASVRRGAEHTPVIVDLPFLSYQVNVEEAVRNAGRVLAETDCHAVKLEGGVAMAPTIRALADRGIPVVGHLGFTPQSVNLLGPRVQGRDDATARKLRDDALAVEAAGACAIVLELVPKALAAEITATVAVPTIGIGAGNGCDGQVLVLHDMLGLNDAFSPRFLKRYGDLAGEVKQAVAHFAADVRSGAYPDDAHSFE
jgi:3-methyl-2-oxobutanoate hydroxymethyltransferase